MCWDFLLYFYICRRLCLAERKYVRALAQLDMSLISTCFASKDLLVQYTVICLAVLVLLVLLPLRLYTHSHFKQFTSCIRQYFEDCESRDRRTHIYLNIHTYRQTDRHQYRLIQLLGHFQLEMPKNGEIRTTYYLE